LDLGEIGWKGSLNDLRAKIHYEADRRRGTAHTSKVNAWTLQFYGEDCMVIVNPGRCTCGAQPGLPHTLGCLMFQTMPTPRLPKNHPDFVATPPAVRSPASPPHRRRVVRGDLPPALEPAPALPPAPEPEPKRFVTEEDLAGITQFATEEEAIAWEEEQERLAVQATALARAEAKALHEARTSAGNTSTSDEESEASLGPCTCGEDPFCTPECARFNR